MEDRNTREIKGCQPSKDGEHVMNGQTWKGVKKSKEEMKMGNGDSKRRMNCSRSFAGALRQQKARLYIIRRCVVMLLCWHD
ncbi:hypothetical protein QJS10_CPB12g00678 [Acorus calamus]|uniref:Uncharacterized protein n=1 Tax=Acorus calamus TaxID=4465 RepID=A0AAV9DPY9_ACOCL|nr:hypothetical protein QJS10_CPB12g00678 [Acorus calamus]